jgi:hypothetical protein
LIYDPPLPLLRSILCEASYGPVTSPESST